MIKVLVCWKSGMGEPKTYTLKEFQTIFNLSNEFNITDNLKGNKIEFIVE
jgi:hypothetical protein